MKKTHDITLPVELIKNIISYNTKPFYKLKEFVPVYELSRRHLSLNPRAINFLLDNSEMIDWTNITFNYNCYDIIKNNKYKLSVQSYKNLCMNTNPEVMPILQEMVERDIRKINFPTLLTNPSALNIIADNMHNIDGYYLDILVNNPNPDLVYILEKYIDNDMIYLANVASRPEFAYLLEHKVDTFDAFTWSEVSKNPKLVHLLEERPDKIDWNNICTNKNARHIIENNLDKVNWQILCEQDFCLDIIERNLDKLNENSWFELSRNKYAISIIERNLDKINFTELSHNISGSKLIDKCLEIANQEEKREIINRVSWETICHITTDLDFLEKYNRYIDYNYLARNKNAGPIIEKYIDNFEPEDFSLLSSNPCIFDFDKINYTRLITSKLVQLPL